MNCTHRAIRSWSQLDGSPIQMWSCVDCGWRFEPVQERKPLTDETLWEMWVESPSDVLRFARAIERAHGIGNE